MNRDRRAAFAALAAFCLGLYGLVGFTASPARADAAELRAKLEALKVGPMKALEVLQTPEAAPTGKFLERDGDEISLRKFRGKVVFLNFWAMWCAPCKKELPSIDRLAAVMQASPHDGDVAVVALNVDRTDGRPKKFLAEKELNTLRFYTDPGGKIPLKEGVRGYPTTLLIDREGMIVARLIGDAEWDSAEAIAVIEAMIEG